MRASEPNEGAGKGQRSAVANRVTVVLTTFNSELVIGRALRAIPAGVRCIVVENASRDDTCAAARVARADVEIVVQKKNQGFGRGNNVGLRMVRTEFAVIINPDLFIAPDCLERCTTAADAHPEVALLGGGQAPPSVGDAKTEGDVVPVAAVMGAFMFMRMSDFRKIGFFDDSIFMYFEDNDLSLRTRLAGRGVALVRSAGYEHIGEGSTSPAFDNRLEKSRLWGQACAYFAIKHSSQPEGRAAKRKIRSYRRKSILNLFALNFDRASYYRNRVRGWSEVVRHGPSVMFKNAFVGD